MAIDNPTKTILCYGDSLTRGFVPGSFDYVNDLDDRYDKKIRWSGVLQSELGNTFDVIESRDV